MSKPLLLSAQGFSKLPQPGVQVLTIEVVSLDLEMKVDHVIDQRRTEEFPLSAGDGIIILQAPLLAGRSEVDFLSGLLTALVRQHQPHRFIQLPVPANHHVGVPLRGQYVGLRHRPHRRLVLPLD